MFAFLRRNTPIAAALALASALSWAPAVHAQTVATVNGAPIPQSRLELFMKMLAANKQPDTPEIRSRVRDQLIMNEVVVQEATRRGLHKTPEIAAQLDMQRQEVLVNALAQEFARANPVTDEIMRKEYERLKQAAPAREYKARHILVNKEDEARDILAQLKKGANFEKLAAERSKDTGSKGRGGDLDWGPANRYVKPFADALARLKKGQTTDAPVQSDFGFHIIRLDDERAPKIPTFEEFKPQLQQGMQQQQIQKLFMELRAKAKVE
ncbi:MAG: peptidylprolyl isomerase [Betaproteobacteria bacterium]|nr:peptidylprolyl isomerase [Betaproteobacteria bacterium]